MDRIPGGWAKRSWPSERPLSTWMVDFAARLTQLDDWTGNPAEIPKVTWVGAFYNPQAFITAILQVTAQKNKWELDKLQTMSDVRKQFQVSEVDSPSRDGAHVNGFWMEGARWDVEANSILRSFPKVMFVQMPVLTVRGISSEASAGRGVYLCPAYKTRFRANTLVFYAQIKTKTPFAQWYVPRCGVPLVPRPPRAPPLPASPPLAQGPRRGGDGDGHRVGGFCPLLDSPS
jgi:dynein heavy chain